LVASKCDEAIKKRVAAGKPTFFICVGIQMLGISSEESPGAVGLEIVPLHVTRFADSVKVPQQGWNWVQPSLACKYLSPGFAYFSNSFKFDTVPEGKA
jgi:imidazoleglycerol phosphate synthase glutamine amidotransferase subunit HisH